MTPKISGLGLALFCHWELFEFEKEFKTDVKDEVMGRSGYNRYGVFIWLGLRWDWWDLGGAASVRDKSKIANQ